MLDVDAALARVLEPGQHIVIGQAYGTPGLLQAALTRHLDRLAGSRIRVGLLTADFPELPGVEITTFFPSGPFGTADGMAGRGVRYDRRTLHELARGLADGDIPADVVLAQGAPVAAGEHSLGVTLDFVAAAAQRAKAVVLETSPRTPHTGRRSTVASYRVLAVPGSSGPLILDRRPSERDRVLAGHLCPLIPDGATLQLGMGPWAAAVAEGLATRRRLRVHSGLVGGWVRDLEAAGALARGVPVVATGAAGDDGFYAWLDATDRVLLAGAHETHDPAFLASSPALWAVNSVLEVDLLGRGNAETGRGGRRGGIGGLPDFARAAAAAEDGCSVIVMAATAGGHSRIVPRLEEAAVSLPAGTIEVLVTEHGVADLRGCAEDARAERIIAVADPGHRAELRTALG